MGDVGGTGQYEDMNTEGHLKGRTNQYALHRLSGPMKGALWVGLASFRLVADIKPLPSDLTLGVMRPSIRARGEGALMVYTHTQTDTHTSSMNPPLRDIMDSIMKQASRRICTHAHTAQS